MAIHQNNGDFYPVDGNPLEESSKISLEELKLIKEDSIIASIPKNKPGEVQFIVPVPSIFESSILQLLSRFITLEEKYRLILRAGVEIGWYIPEHIGFDLKNGKFATTDVFIIVSCSKSAAKNVADIVIDSESGHGSAIRRAPDISRMFIRGISKLDGFKKAFIKVGEYKDYSFNTQSGEGVLVTEAFAEYLEGLQ